MKSRWFLFFNIAVVFCGLEIGAQRSGASNYWQQHVDYKIEVDVNVETAQYEGKQRVVYTNNSPDRLVRVFFHLYFNAFQPGSEMDVHSRNIADPDSRVMGRIEKLEKKDQGYLSVYSIKQDGVEINSHVAGTVLEVDLNKPIRPGESTVFDMAFLGQAPLIIRRAGKQNKEGVALSMAQWYPKLAEYDHEGWHASPYIGREFHGVWGDFDVKLTIDKNFVVGGTGYLQNPEAVEMSSNKSTSKNTWHFIAPNVHDFTWAADPDYIHDILEMEGGPKLHFYYKNTLSEKQLENWKKLQPVTAKLMLFFNENIGTYPYDQYSVIQGGDGGMEYGMCTLITANRSFESLVGVTAHELAHSWFQFVLATNESKHEWMDEGFTEYYCTQAEASIMGVDEEGVFKSAYNRYRKLALSGLEQPQTTHADRFKFNASYGVSAYTKGSIFLRQLKHIIGAIAFDKAMKNYFSLWSFKHPTPNDFIRCAEKSSGAELDWYLTDWTMTTNTIDYAVDSVTEAGDMVKVNLKRIGLMPIPIEVKVLYEGGAEENFYIPLQMMRAEKPLTKEITLLKDWAWARPIYDFTFIKKGEIKSITLDPDHKIADVNLNNNSYIKYSLE
ncbi:MAG: M1 family metallopeptidase [Flavobacteriaceae bacterium]